MILSTPGDPLRRPKVKKGRSSTRISRSDEGCEVRKYKSKEKIKEMVTFENFFYNETPPNILDVSRDNW